LQKLYAPIESQKDTLFCSTGTIESKMSGTKYHSGSTICRVDLEKLATLSVKYEPQGMEKVSNIFKTPKAEDKKNSIDKYLSKFSVASLNSKMQVSEDEKINQIEAFINKQQSSDNPYDLVLYFSGNKTINECNEEKVYHSIDSIRSIVFELLVENPEAKILLVYNPPPKCKGEVVIILTPDAIFLNDTAVKLKIGEFKQLTANILPDNVSEDKKRVIWKSDNPSIATVDENGVVTAIANGMVVISAYTGNGFRDTCSVKIGESHPPVTAEILNRILIRIAKSDDKARDEMRKLCGNNCKVVGAANIDDVQELIVDASIRRYKVVSIKTNTKGKPVSITVKSL